MNRELWNEFAATLNVFLVRKLNAGNAEPQAVLFPLAGALTGFLCTLAAAVAVLFFGRLAAAILAAIVLPLLLELLTDWHGLKISPPISRSVSAIRRSQTHFPGNRNSGKR